MVYLKEANMEDVQKEYRGQGILQEKRWTK